MSASWNRAHELGQPFTLMVIGVSKPGSRRSSSVYRSTARPWSPRWRACRTRCRCRPSCPRRNTDGLDLQVARRELVRQLGGHGSLGHVEDQQLLRRWWCGPGPSRRPRPGRRPATAGCRRCGRCSAPRPRSTARPAGACTPMWSRDPGGGAGGAGPSGSASRPGTPSPAPRGTARCPSRRPGTSAGPGCAAGGSRSRGTGWPRPLHTSGTRSGGTNAPRRWASIGLVDSPPPTHRSNPGVAVRADDADERDVVDLVRGALGGAAEIAVLNLRGRLVSSGLAGRDGLGRPQHRAGVEHLGARQIPATGQPRMLRGTSPQACWLDRPTSSSRSQICGHVLDRDPVELDVLPVGDVGQVAAVLLGDTGNGAQLVGGQLPAGDAHPHHEVRVLDLGVLERTGLARRRCRACAGCTGPTSGTGRAGRAGRWSRSPGGRTG